MKPTKAEAIRQPDNGGKVAEYHIMVDMDLDLVGICTHFLLLKVGIYAYKLF